MENVVRKAEETKNELELCIYKMRYLHFVYTRINKMFSTEDSDKTIDRESARELRFLTGALAEGIKMSLGILGVEPEGKMEVSKAQLQKDVNKILDELHIQFSKEKGDL